MTEWLPVEQAPPRQVAVALPRMSLSMLNGSPMLSITASIECQAHTQLLRSGRWVRLEATPDVSMLRLVPAQPHDPRARQVRAIGKKADNGAQTAMVRFRPPELLTLVISPGIPVHDARDEAGALILPVPRDWLDLAQREAARDLDGHRILSPEEVAAQAEPPPARPVVEPPAQPATTAPPPAPVPDQDDDDPDSDAAPHRMSLIAWLIKHGEGQHRDRKFLSGLPHAGLVAIANRYRREMGERPLKVAS